MKTYSIFIFSTLLFFSPTKLILASDHIDDLLDNSDITWAAEVYTDYTPNVNHFALGKKKMLERYGIPRNSFTTLKIQQQTTQDQIHLSPTTLTEEFLSMAESSQQLFKDAALKEPLSYDQENGTAIDLKMYANQVDMGAIQLFRVKQILHYNTKTNQLDVTPIAIAPIFSTYNKDGQLINTKPLFWMTIKSISQITDLNLPSINWAKRITRSIDTKEVSVIKGKETFAEILNKILDLYIENPSSSKLYRTYGKMSPLNSKEVKELKTGIDTLITFDPKTFEEHVTVVKNPVNSKTMHSIRIVQDWVWDKDKKAISIRLVAFAPLLERYDNQQNFLNSGPVFYKKPNE